jgi:preprotein translocase subunit SecG
MASNLLGTKTGDFLTWVTIGLVSVFLLLAIVMAKFYKPEISDFAGPPPVQQSAPQEQPKPELPASAAPAAAEKTDANLPGK